MKLETRILSSLDTVWPDSCPEAREPHFTFLRNERFSFQVAFRMTDHGDNAANVNLEVESPVAGAVTVRIVASVPVMRPVYNKSDEYYVKKEPGMYPDPLMPLRQRFRVLRDNWRSLWVTVNADAKKLKAGSYPLILKLTAPQANETRTVTVELNIINALLPEQPLIVTNWMHCDCICDAHGVKPFSRAFWPIYANYLRAAAASGQNMVLTPAFTPPLDTPVGGERMTCQLVGVTLDKGRYSFDFTLLEKFIKTALRCGIKYFEHSHLFTQWGVEHAPKVMATVDGEYRRIFGWETDANGGEYREFLEAYLSALSVFLKEHSVDTMMFHISDEPSPKHLESYARAKAMIRDILGPVKVFDALHAYEFYERGLVEYPVVGTGSIHNFLGRCDSLWAYYIGTDSHSGKSNRLISCTSPRNRILGWQLWKFDCKGFLHWGFNFWYRTLSEGMVDPYLSPDGECDFIGGTSFLVYPGEGGPNMSLRAVVFGEGVQDNSALRLLESLVGREKVEAIIGEFFEDFSFNSCPDTPDVLLAMRDRVNLEIAKNV